jgi:hypothetical protein
MNKFLAEAFYILRMQILFVFKLNNHKTVFMKTKVFQMTFTLMLIITSPSYSQQTVTGFEAPESVIKSGNKLFVSNIGGTQPNPMALDSNGFITALSADGKLIEKKFQKSVLNGPKGLAISGNVLYTADVNRVVGFDINSGDEVFELNIPDAMMLNDLCTINNNQLAVSESISGKIYSINIIEKTHNFLGRIEGANGVTYDAKTGKLYACGMGTNMNGTGKLFVKDFSANDTSFVQLPNSPTGIFDGLEMIDNDHLLVTDWISFNSSKGRLVVYNLKDHTNKIYSIDAGPADISYDKISGNFYLPQMMKNSLLIENMSSLKPE